MSSFDASKFRDRTVSESTDQELSSSPEKQDYEKRKRIAYIILGISVALTAGIIIAMTVWLILRDPPSVPAVVPSASPIQLVVDFGLNNSSDAVLILSNSAPIKLVLKSLSGGDNATLHLASTHGPIREYIDCSGIATQPCFHFNDTQQEYAVSLTHETYSADLNFKCTTVSWNASLNAEVSDCIELGNSHWFGGGSLFQQRWPLELKKTMTPFVSADYLESSVRNEYGSVLEPYWISTDGFAFSVNWDATNQPLHTSWNSTGDGRLCIMARYKDSPFIPADQKFLRLKHTTCVGQSVEHVHKAFLQYRKPWEKPSGTPEETLFQRPLWSTGSTYATQLTQDNLLDFITKLASHTLPVSYIEINDGYQAKYGDFSFDVKKFSCPRDVIAVAIASRGFKVSVWVHPFVNYDADAFSEAVKDKHLVGTVYGNSPATTSWWRGEVTGLIDFTNTTAANWYFRRLKDFADFMRPSVAHSGCPDAANTTVRIQSFKFDGGESNWIPITRKTSVASVSPDFYGKRYVEAIAKETGNNGRIRVGLHTQHLPLIVRMLNKNSVSGYDNGLRTLIPTALTYGLLGYSFVLPDIVGGNPAGSDFPSAKLYLRWLGAVLFMPSIQFSITPWHYDQSSGLDVVNTTRRLLDLRAKYNDMFTNLAQKAVETGHPIIRPMWWINGVDSRTWTIDDQFLVGGDLIIAPVLSIESDSRDIYIPAGTWFDELRKENIVGPEDRRQAAAIDEVLIFRRLP